MSLKQTRPIARTVGIRPVRNGQRTRQNQVRRQRNQRNINELSHCRVHHNVPTNNQDTLNDIANLLPQVINDPLLNQFFNGGIGV
ncbi:5317_t:CDS:2 [Funneliformis geosporum]|nr:5317_t:CDS:2 [Funneliformis geosporum]